MDKKKALSLIIAVLVLVGVGAGYSMFATKEATQEQVVTTPEASIAPVEETPPTTEVTEAVPAAGEASAPVVETGPGVDVQKALAVRALGNPDAPVKLQEFASLSCPHCAHFHAENYEKLKAEYIDTGKVYFIFTDFPLNAPALDAAMIARCLPEERYFSFIKFLFDNQDKWAFQPDVRNSLKQNAKLVGASDEMLEACLNNQEIKQGLVDTMTAMTEKYKVESTPSFVLNEKPAFKGAVTYDVVKKEIDSALGTSGETKAE